MYRFWLLIICLLTISYSQITPAQKPPGAGIEKEAVISRERRYVHSRSTTTRAPSWLRPFFAPVRTTLKPTYRPTGSYRNNQGARLGDIQCSCQQWDLIEETYALRYQTPLFYGKSHILNAYVWPMAIDPARSQNDCRLNQLNIFRRLANIITCMLQVPWDRFDAVRGLVLNLIDGYFKSIKAEIIRMNPRCHVSNYCDPNCNGLSWALKVAIKSLYQRMLFYYYVQNIKIPIQWDCYAARWDSELFRSNNLYSTVSKVAQLYHQDLSRRGVYGMVNIADYVPHLLYINKTINEYPYLGGKSFVPFTAHQSKYIMIYLENRLGLLFAHNLTAIFRNYGLSSTCGYACNELFIFFRATVLLTLGADSLKLRAVPTRPMPTRKPAGHPMPTRKPTVRPNYGRQINIFKQLKFDESYTKYLKGRTKYVSAFNRMIFLNFPSIRTRVISIREGSIIFTFLLTINESDHRRMEQLIDNKAAAGQLTMIVDGRRLVAKTTLTNFSKSLPLISSKTTTTTTSTVHVSFPPYAIVLIVLVVIGAIAAGVVLGLRHFRNHQEGGFGMQRFTNA